MASEQSDRACTLCRQRRVRCDKTLPTCRRCSKFGQTCPGYPSRQRFIDQSNAVRNKLNDHTSPSSSASGQQASVSLESSPRILTGSDFRAARQRKNRDFRNVNAGLDKTQTLPVVERSSISTASDHAIYTSPAIYHPIHQQPTPGNSLSEDSPVEGFMVDVPMQQLLDDPDFDYFDLDIDSYYANGTNACGFFPGIPVSLPSEDGLGVLDGIHDSQLMRSGKTMPTTRNGSTTSGLRPSEVSLNKEVALLIHLFVDFLAPWMDLFDFDAYFTRVLPADAMPNILLQSAVAAVAAKQTARHVMNGSAEPASRHYAYIVANYQDVSSNEWFYKAACYYDRGISHLRAQLQQSSTYTDEVSNLQTNTFAAGTPSDYPSHHSPQQLGDKPSNTQNLFSAISILSLYESLDDCLANSSQHLPGFLALFEHGSAPSVPRSLTAGRAAFWYFARKEALASYAHHIKPRIDPDNISMWASAGMPIQVLHLLTPQASVLNSPSSPNPVILEDRDSAHRILIWILTKVTNLINADHGGSDRAMAPFHDLSDHRSTASFQSANENTQTFNNMWNTLRGFMMHWYDNRSCLLMPHATVDTKNPYNSSSKPLRIAFFSNSTAVAVLQLYHFIQILLLINQPTSHMDQGSRLRMLKENSIEVEYHSREICAVASGRQPLAIQRHMSHPLQLAGAYFEAKEDRETIYGLLREVAIETSSPIEVAS